MLLEQYDKKDRKTRDRLKRLYYWKAAVIYADYKDRELNDAKILKKAWLCGIEAKVNSQHEDIRSEEDKDIRELMDDINREMVNGHLDEYLFDIVKNNIGKILFPFVVWSLWRRRRLRKLNAEK